MTALSTNQLVAVVGAGTMGAGIAQVAATAGHRVVLYDLIEGAAERALTQIDARLKKQVAKGKQSEQVRSQIVQNIRPSSVLQHVKHAALVIEAIVEQLSVKRKLIAELESLVSDQTLIASNTSSLSITSLAAGSLRPNNIVGMHFFNPAAILPLVEIVSGLHTSQSTANAAFATAAAWGKSPVHTKSTPGFIVNRVARPFYAEAFKSLTECVADAAVIDSLMRTCGGFKMGPLELTDLIGHDVNYAVTESVYRGFNQDPRFRPSVYQAELVAAGMLGRKTGKGVYHYCSGTNQRIEKTKADPVSRPYETVTLRGDLGQMPGIHELLVDAQLTIEEHPITEQPLSAAQIDIGDARICVSDGRTATERAAVQGIDNLVLIDYAMNYQQTSTIGLAICAQGSLKVQTEAVAFFESLGKQVLLVKDVPGMQVLRTVCMLINEAFDAVNQGVCDQRDLDQAMCLGVAYPLGPFAWCELIGAQRVVNVLSNIKAAYGEERYRVSPLLAQRVYEQPQSKA